MAQADPGKANDQLKPIVPQIGKLLIEKEKARMNASNNGFVRICCRQKIEELIAEKSAIEEEVVG